MKEFYATAEKVLRVESGNPVVRSVIKECVEKGFFDANLHIDSRPMIDYVTQEVANCFRP